MTDQFLVHRNQQAINEASQGFYDALPIYAKVLQEFKMLNLGEMDTAQFIEAVTDPREFLNKRIEARLIAAKTPLSFAGVTLRPSAVVAMADDSEQQIFIESCHAAKPVLLYFKILGRVHHGKIEVDKMLLDTLIKAHTIIAVTDTEREILGHLKSIVNGVNGLVKMGKIDDYTISGHMIAHYIQRIGKNNFVLNPVMFSSLTR